MRRVRDMVERTVQSGLQEAAREGDAHSLTDAIWPAAPADLTSQQRTSLAASRSLSIDAYTTGSRGMKGAPKHVENVGLGPHTSVSVPATLAVNPERKW